MAPPALEIIAGARTIALVGASPRPARPSNSAMAYPPHPGDRAIPVHPGGPADIRGVPRVAALSEIEESIDLVDVCRRAEFCPGVAEEAVAAGAGALWLQLGVVSPKARAIAEAAGLAYVENACTAIVHGQLANRA